MKQLNLAKGCEIAAWDHLIKQRLKFKACKRAAKNYTSNLTRAHAISMLPGYAFQNGEYWGISVCAAMKDLGSSDNTDPGVTKYASDIFLDHRKNRPRDQSIFDYREAVENFDRVTYRVPTIRDGLYAWFESMIVQAWGAFEVLSEDLWRNVIDQRPALDTNITWPKNWKTLPDFDQGAELQTCTDGRSNRTTRTSCR